MAKFVKGEVLVFPFPFSVLSWSKRRPVLVIAALEGDDLILCQITSKDSGKDNYSILLTSQDFQSGSLPVDSYIRPNRLFTGDSNIVIRSAGKITRLKINEVIRRIEEIINQ